MADSNEKDGITRKSGHAMTNETRGKGSDLFKKRTTQSEMVEKAFKVASERTGLFKSTYAK